MILLAGNDPDLGEWIANIDRMHAGGFLRAVSEAAWKADWTNYALMRPLLLQLKEKYPEYDGPRKPIARSA